MAAAEEVRSNGTIRALAEAETSGTAQRLRRMRRLNKSSAHHQPTHTTTEGSSTTTLPSSSGQDGPAAIPWCVDCDQPLEPDQEE